MHTVHSQILHSLFLNWAIDPSAWHKSLAYFSVQWFIEEENGRSFESLETNMPRGYCFAGFQRGSSLQRGSKYTKWIRLTSQCIIRADIVDFWNTSGSSWSFQRIIHPRFTLFIYLFFTFALHFCLSTNPILPFFLSSFQHHQTW